MKRLLLVFLCFLVASDTSNGVEFLLAAVSNGGLRGIYKYEAGTWNTVLGGASFTHEPVEVGFDSQKKRVIWNSPTEHLIYSAFLNGSDTRVVVNYTLSGTTQTTVDGLYMESSTGLLYFTEILRGSMHVFHEDSGKEAVILKQEGEAPRDIAFDSTRKKLFFSDWGVLPSVWQANSDGTSPQQLAASYPWSAPNGIHYDDLENVVYVCDVHFTVFRETHLIKISLNNNSAQFLTKFIGSHCFDVEGNSSHLFMSDWMGNRIWLISKTSFSNQVLHSFPNGRVYGLHYHKMTSTTGSPCTSTNCASNKLCIPQDLGVARCVCLKGFTGPSCTELEPYATHPAYAFTAPEALIGLVGYPDTYLKTQARQTFSLSGQLEFGSAVAIDSHKELAYVYAVDRKSIVRMSLYAPPNSRLVTLRSSMPVTSGMAIDWTVEILYLTINDANLKAIYFMDATNGRLSSLATGNIQEPRGIAVDPSRGIVVWCDAALGRVESIATDGSGRRVLQQLSGAASIVFNYAAQTLLVAAESFVYSMSNTGDSASKVIDLTFQQRQVLSADFHSDVLVALTQNSTGAIKMEFFDMKHSYLFRGSLNVRGPAFAILAHHVDRQPEQVKNCAALQCSEFCVSSQRQSAMCICPSSLAPGCPGANPGSISTASPVLTKSTQPPPTSNKAKLSSTDVSNPSTQMPTAFTMARQTLPSIVDSSSNPQTQTLSTLRTSSTSSTRAQEAATSRWGTPVTAGIVVLGLVIVTVVVAAVIIYKRKSSNTPASALHIHNPSLPVRSASSGYDLYDTVDLNDLDTQRTTRYMELKSSPYLAPSHRRPPPPPPSESNYTALQTLPPPVNGPLH